MGNVQNESNARLKDEAVIEKILSENKPELFEILYHRYHQKVVDKVFSFLKNRKIAQEFSNDILTKVYEKLPGFRGTSSFSSWVYSITYNYCIDYLRLQKRLHYPDWNKTNVIPEIPDESEEDLSGATFENVMAILELVHPEEKALLLMKYQDQLSLKEIAQTLRVSEDAVKMRLKRARTRVYYLYRERYS
ncbi:MAG TPA: RNA polymerase sigma factor [Prolixibacteraceae bacterium]|nr:RNA polymerase sigma factor [Prolixibacteraceae bacterium]HQE52795.1 RNA polymerase sigma factor [Prolixibacteraceae bacterium]HQH76804.1 RNA polymerase sigma factor [Prolixibacteraceae bacterium]HQJ86066.1 RNA polymerase sigma factor [Prolixibacteraceae bacterium]